MTSDFVLFENEGSDSATCPDASRTESHAATEDPATPMSRDSSARFSSCAVRKEQARRNRSESRRLDTCSIWRRSRSREKFAVFGEFPLIKVEVVGILSWWNGNH